jgi:hypothetical protein
MRAPARPPEAVLEAARAIGQAPGYSPPEDVLIRALSHPYASALVELGFTWEPLWRYPCAGCKARKTVSLESSAKGERFYEIRCSRCRDVQEREWPHWMWMEQPTAPLHLQRLAIPLASILAKAGGKDFWRERDFAEKFYMVWGADAFLKAADDMAAGRAPVE